MQVSGSAPKPPSWLIGEARQEWRRIVPLLRKAGVLCGLDRAILAAYCQAWAEFVGAQKTVAETGPTTTTSNDNVIMHPAYSAMTKAWTRLVRCAKELGLSPAARMGVQAVADAVNKPVGFR